MFKKLLCLLMVVIMLAICLPSVVSFAEAAPNYLTFTAEEDGSTITLNVKSANSIQYRQKIADAEFAKDDSDWLTYTPGTQLTLAKVGDSVQFKGSHVITQSKNHFTMTGKIAASGSVTSLTDGLGNDANVVLDQYSYTCLFEGCSSLTTAPTLPALTMVNNCYDGMFKDCT